MITIVTLQHYIFRGKIQSDSGWRLEFHPLLLSISFSFASITRRMVKNNDNFYDIYKRYTFHSLDDDRDICRHFVSLFLITNKNSVK